VSAAKPMPGCEHDEKGEDTETKDKQTTKLIDKQIDRSTKRYPI
jgi:hypothetical protein